MIYLKDYMNDGASPQARVVLNYLKDFELDDLPHSFDKDLQESMCKITVARYDNGRERGYAISVYGNIPRRYVDPNRYEEQKAYTLQIAFYQHRSSDALGLTITEIAGCRYDPPRRYNDFGTVSVEFMGYPYGAEFEAAVEIQERIEDFWRRRHKGSAKAYQDSRNAGKEGAK